MSVTNQAYDTLVLIPVKPLIDAIRISRLQEAVLGYPMRRMPLSNLEQCRAPFSHVRQRVMMDRFLQRHTLWLIQPDIPVVTCFTHLAHRKLLSWKHLPLRVYAYRSWLLKFIRGGMLGNASLDKGYQQQQGFLDWLERSEGAFFLGSFIQARRFNNMLALFRCEWGKPVDIGT